MHGRSCLHGSILALVSDNAINSAGMDTAPISPQTVLSESAQFDAEFVNGGWFAIVTTFDPATGPSVRLEALLSDDYCGVSPRNRAV